MSLRTRITLLTALLLLFSTSLIGATACIAAYRINLDVVDTSLQGAVADARIRSIQNQRGPNPVPEDAYLPIAIGVLKPNSQSVEMVRAAGTGINPLPFPSVNRAMVDEALVHPIDISGSLTYRVVARSSPNGRDIVVAASPIDDTLQGLRSLAVGIGIAVLVVTALGALLSWLIVRRTFRPVNAMVGAAQSIADGNTDTRVPKASAGTELGELSEALNNMIGSLVDSVNRVEQSEERLRGFVSDASHEIRTPLTVIRGYVELLLRDPDARSELSIRALERIDSESARLDRLVTQLLLLERVATAPQKRERVNLGVLVRTAFEDLQQFQPERAVEIDVDDVSIPADQDGWGQLVSNIVQNLQRHTPSNAAVRVSLHRIEGRVELLVDDAGPGIPPEQRARVMDRFGRMGTGPDGFGLGMSITAAVVSAHGGTMELLESPWGGLRLRIRVPAENYSPDHT